VRLQGYVPAFLHPYVRLPLYRKPKDCVPSGMARTRGVCGSHSYELCPSSPDDEAE